MLEASMQLAIPLTTPSSTPALTVLSLGLGQESTALLYLAHHDPDFRARFCPGRFLVLSADTGDEFPETIQLQTELAAWCQTHNLEYVHITPSMGFHRGNWQSLRAFYRATHTVGSKSFRHSCADNLKISVISRYLTHWLHREYGVSTHRKDGFIQFRNRVGVIRMLIGFSKGEESRRATPETLPKWRRYSMEMVYPLIDLGYDRLHVQQIIASLGYRVPPPSNCMLCPYTTQTELLLLARKYPADYAEWVELERNKREKFAHLGDKNYGVWGKKLLPMVLDDAYARYGHLSTAELEAMRFSRGHDVRSKY